MTSLLIVLTRPAFGSSLAQENRMPPSAIGQTVMNDGALVLRFVMRFFRARVFLPAHSWKFLSTRNRMPSGDISSSHFAAGMTPQFAS